MKERIKMTIGLLFMVAMTSFVFYACDTKKESDQEEDVEVVELVAPEVTWVVDEHQMNDIPLTSAATSYAQEDLDDAASSEAEKDESEMEAQASEMEAEAEAELDAEVEEEMAEAEYEEEYEIAQAEAIDEALLEAEYIEKTTIEVTQAIVPLDETQTVIAYNKKGEAISGIQVVTTPDGEVEQVIFQDKKHKDVYDISTGMSGKEAKKLRKELKHMEHKGKVFLYDESSNIMYLTDIQNMAGDEITEVDIENSEVTAIIWKDKKHHKKMKDNS